MSVDVVIPVFNEQPPALEATLRSCLNQDHPVSNIWIVDDGSESPVQIPSNLRHDHVHGLRLAENRGIAAARNEAIRNSQSGFVACVNTEVILPPDWIQTCVDHLRSNQTVAACTTPIRPSGEARILARWRMRFQEQSYPSPDYSGPIPFAAGHAVLFRRAALDQVKGYDERFRRVHEDADICFRLRAAGWETHLVSSTHALSIQRDSLKFLAKKQLRFDGWLVDPAPAEDPLLVRPRAFPFLLKQTRSLLHRCLRNTLSLRLEFIPIDFAVWWIGIRMGRASWNRADSKREP